ncbi:hypothetical protein DENSPDRAFT_926089 [Dentipellis sp. KUC8613]|nr:hypothetical protein DENSPDRAFT_926089 [Dentipellis sp. KUC8613]
MAPTRKADAADRAAPRSHSSDLYRFHRPKLRLDEAPHPLKRESQRCLQNLAAYRTPPQLATLPFPRSRRAAVLVALFVGRQGDLYVLLSRRAATLRSYAGDTALPGGRVDPEDATIEDTARREAFEEIGLPADKTKVPLLCVLEPYLAGATTLVTPTLPKAAGGGQTQALVQLLPVVVLILDTTLRPILNAAEVHALFSHPLGAFLASTPPAAPHLRADTNAEAEAEAEQAALELPYHTYFDMPWPHTSTPAPAPARNAGPTAQDQDQSQNERAVRMHRFLTGREAGGVKPVYGLTAAILIRTALIGYAPRAPTFALAAPHQPSMGERIAHALRHGPGPALCAAEGIDAEQAAAAWEACAIGKSGKKGRRGVGEWLRVVKL